MQRTAAGRLRPAPHACEPLESRTLLAGAPADIRWLNAATTTSGGAADTDGFGAAFGTMAPVARNIVHSIIDTYEVMIGSFNYAAPGDYFRLTLRVGAPGTGFGGLNTLTGHFSGKPAASTITIDGGNNDGIPNNDNGWFLDPSPYEASEFMGTVWNAFSGEAAFGSPAHDKWDFYSQVAHEMAHAVGFGNLAAFTDLTTNTGVADYQHGGTGNFYVFRGPSIKHLLTSYNNGTDSGVGKHTVGLSGTVTFDGDVYWGATDLLNTPHRRSTRYLVSNTLALMLKDAYAYDVVMPADFYTFYAGFNQATGELMVRGGDGFWVDGSSRDVISVWWDGSYLNVSVDISNDPAGTGALPGWGNLGPYVTRFGQHLFSHVTINALGDHDSIFVHDAIVPTTVYGSSGSDLIIVGGGDYDGNILSFVSVDGDDPLFADPASLDVLRIDDTADTAANDTHNLLAGSYGKPGAGTMAYTRVESIQLFGDAQAETFNILSTAANTPVFVSGRGGNDSFVVGNPTLDHIASPVQVIGGAGNDTVRFRDDADVQPATYNLANTAFSRGGGGTGAVAATWSEVEAVALTGGIGADTINLNFASGSPNATISGGSGDDVININPAGYTSTDFQNPVSLTGGDGIDVLRFNANPGSTTTIYPGSFDSTNTPTYISFAITIEVFQFFGTASADTFVVRGTSAGPSTFINAEGGNDTIHVGSTPDFAYHMDDVDGNLTVNGQDGTDTVTFSDAGLTTAKTYTVNAASIVRAGSANLNFNTAELVELVAGSAIDTFNVTETAPGVQFAVDGGAGFDMVNVNTDAIGSAAVHFRAPRDEELATLNILAGGLAAMSHAGNARVLTTRTLSVAPGARFDVGDENVIIDYAPSGPFPAANVRAWLTTGRNGGAWNGASGIVSSAAATTPGTAVGYAEASALFTAFPATFAGQQVDSTALLLRFTRDGDANLDRTVDLSDFNRLAARFGQSNRVWSDGDFTYDGTVNLQDFNVLAGNFGRTVSPASSASTSSRPEDPERTDAPLDELA